VIEEQLRDGADEAARAQLVVGLAPAVQIARLLVGIVRDAGLHAKAAWREWCSPPRLDASEGVGVGT